MLRGTKRTLQGLTVAASALPGSRQAAKILQQAAAKCKFVSVWQNAIHIRLEKMVPQAAEVALRLVGVAPYYNPIKLSIPPLTLGWMREDLWS